MEIGCITIVTKQLKTDYFILNYYLYQQIIMTKFQKHLSEPWFSLIKVGMKTCEGRLNKGEFSKMKKDDIIMFINGDLPDPRSFCVRISAIHYYDTFGDYLINEGLYKCLPGIDSIAEGINVYHKYYSESDESQYGIVAIQITNC